ncbi:MAG: hypothetical protein EGQ57_01245 [Alphaproteobacteria bacterium]|nr:hypothetical protein [Alphaproteobacteria bacterium]
MRKTADFIPTEFCGAKRTIQDKTVFAEKKIQIRCSKAAAPKNSPKTAPLRTYPEIKGKKPKPKRQDR